LSCFLTLVCVAGGVAGCRFVRGSDRKDPGDTAGVVTRRLTGDAWLDGKLPASILKGTPVRGGQAIVQIDVDPPNLNINVESEYWGAQVVFEHVSETLVANDRYDDPQFRIVPALAERWEISPDKLSYTFHLRHGVRWHDGHAFSARDVIATFDKIQDPNSKAAAIRAYTQDIDQYRALDDYTVQFRLKKPYFLVMDGVFASVIIQPAHIIERMSGSQYSEAATNPLNRAPIGTGPFRFDYWKSGQAISLVRNEQYWGKPAYLDRVVFRIVPEAPVAIELAQRGELDVVARVRTNQWVKLNHSPLERRFYRSLFYDANYGWIGWNLVRPQFREAQVRKALTMLVDRPGIINALEFGLAMPTTCHFYWGSNACDKTLLPLPYDPVRAVSLLEAAGWADHDGDGTRDRNGVPFRFNFMIPSGSEAAARMATKMKEDFARAGIDLILQRVDWSAFVRRVTTHDFDACTMFWSGNSRDDPTQIWSSASIDGGSNFVSFSNAVADRIMREARVELDDDRRDALYRQLGRILYDEQPYTWLYVRPQLALISKRLHGVKTSLLGWGFEDWWVTDALVPRSRAD
jgi:peptide/nickel transport system substrate-binding protein